MNQSTVIFGALSLAFLIFIIQRGELGTYWGFLVSKPQVAPSGPTATGSGNLSGAVSAITTGAEILGAVGG